MVNGRTLVGSVQLPLEDLETAAGLNLSALGDRETVSGPALGSIQRYVADHFSIRIDDLDAQIVFGEALVRALTSGPYLYIDFQVPGIELRRPGSVAVTYDALFDSMPHRQALLIFLVSYGWRGFYRHEETKSEFDGDHRTGVFQVPEPTALENAGASLGQLRRLVRGKSGAALRRMRRSPTKA